MSKEKQAEWWAFWREVLGPGFSSKELWGVDLDYVE